MVRSSRLGFEKILIDCAFKIIVGGVVISPLLLVVLSSAPSMEPLILSMDSLSNS